MSPSKLILLCPFTPPRRLHLFKAAPVLEKTVADPFVPRAPRVHFAALQHIKNRRPFSQHLRFSPRVPEACPAPGKSRSQGLATLSARLAISCPVKASFSLRRSWASPFRAFLLSGGRRKVPLPLSAPALCCETSRPRIGAPAAFSHRKSRAPFSSPKV